MISPLVMRPGGEAISRMTDSIVTLAEPLNDKNAGYAPCSASQRSASIAAAHPMPAAVMAWR